MLERIKTTLALWWSRRSATSLLAVLGVAIGTANIIALIGVTDTARRQTLGILRDMGMDTVLVFPFADDDKESLSMHANATAFLPTEMLDAAKSVDALDKVAGVLMLPLHVKVGEVSQFMIVEGAEPDYPEIRGHGIELGRFITLEDEAQHAKVCVIGFGMDQLLFGSPGITNRSLSLKGEQFEVVGMMIEKGMAGLRSMDDRVFIPLSTAQGLFEINGMHIIITRAKSGTDPHQAKAQLEKVLAKATGLADGQPADYSVTTADELTDVLASTMGVFRALLYGISSIALLVAGIGIMNVMLMQVLERTREIGVRRAVGATAPAILWQFLKEAVWQASAGAVLGIGLGVGAAGLFCSIMDWQLYLAPTTVALAVGVSLGTGVIFGIYPAAKAAKLKPIDCLRYE